MKEKIWFMTGASRGFGKIWAEAALQRGDKVVATARNIDTLRELQNQYGEKLLALPLNVNNRRGCFEAIQKAKQHFGQLDVVINNAGYGLFGVIEEISEEDAREQMETNFFGALWVTQAALPVMREQGNGHILQTSSVGGILANQNLGLYHASKWALEAFSESLSKEVKDFGIHITLIEPGGYDTDWRGSSGKHAKHLPAYDTMREGRAKMAANFKQGNPEATAEAIMKIVDDPNPPLRLFLGKQPLEWVKTLYAQRLESWEQWQPLSEAAQ